MKRALIIVAVVCVCTISTMYVTLSNRTKDPTTVPCKNACCEDVAKTDAYIPERVEILRDRARTLQERCEQLYGLEKDNGTTYREPRDTHYLLASDKFKLLFCYIPKVACSNVRRTFLILNGIVNKTKPIDITYDELQILEKSKLKRLPSYSKDGIRYRLRNYTKVMFVRDPFERLISAFNDKLTGHGPYFLKNVKQSIIKTLQLDKVHAENITFANFIQYLIIENGKNATFNEHWATYTRICDPCRIQYDYIGAYETIDEDMGAVLKEIGADFIHFPTRKDSPHYNSTRASADLIEAFYKDIPDSNIKRLKEIYAKDMLLFGLEVPKALARLEKGTKQT